MASDAATKMGNSTAAKKAPLSDNQIWIDVKGLAARWGVSQGYIFKSMKLYGLKFYKFGRATRFKVKEAEDWASKRGRS